MRIIAGLYYALGGAALGFGIGVVAVLLIAKATDMSNREGAIGYSAVALGLVGAVIGLIVGIVLHARSAPSGQAAAFGGSTVLGVAAIAGVIVLAGWARLNLMEKPLQYDGAMATLELELRLDSAHAPLDSTSSWLEVEVQAGETRPEGTVAWSAVRTEGAQRIIPVYQNPLIRATNRAIVVGLRGRHREVFIPPMRRTPDTNADWSEWYRPARVELPPDAPPGAPASALVELRYRVRRYGE